jgi:hypothetical protein
MIAGFFKPRRGRSKAACQPGRFQTARIDARSRRRSQELAELVKTWPQVTPEIRSAVLTLVRTTTGAQK